MKKGIVIFISLAIITIVTLYLYGYKQGETMGERGSSELGVSIIALTMNPLTQAGFRLGYQDGVAEKEKLDKWSNEYFGSWTGWKSKDKITDFENYFLKNEGDIGPYNKKAALNVRCLNNKTEIYVSWGAYLTGDLLEVTHRVDSQNIQKTNWSMSTDKKSFFYSGNHISFIKSLIGHEELTLRFRARNTKTLSFNLNKLDEKIKPLAKACHWEI